MNKDYYINMKDVMENEYTELPRPTLKIIYIPTGEDPKWQAKKYDQDYYTVPPSTPSAMTTT